jgi:hypothetical protein
MNEASARRACEEALSGTQTHDIRRLDSINAGRRDEGTPRPRETRHENVIHDLEQRCTVRILGE